VPKKRKTVQENNSPSSANGPSRGEEKIGKKRSRVGPTGAKKSAPVRKTAKAGAGEGLKSAHLADPSDEAIRTRAYFIAERRHRLELAGDENTDWIEARRQLLAEAGAVN
jgi:Protein of unknown function (DUF2934)